MNTLKQFRLVSFQFDQINLYWVDSIDNPVCRIARAELNTLLLLKANKL